MQFGRLWQPFDDAGAVLGFTVTAETRAEPDRIIPMLQEAHRVLALVAAREIPRADSHYRELTASGAKH